MSKPPKKPDGYMKYSNIAYQMLGVLLLSGYIGFKIDAYFETEKKYFTAGLMFFMLVTYLWKIVIETSKDTNKK